MMQTMVVEKSKKTWEKVQTLNIEKDNGLKLKFLKAQNWWLFWD